MNRIPVYILLFVPLIIAAACNGQPTVPATIKIVDEAPEQAKASPPLQHLPGPDFELEPSKTTLVQTLLPVLPAKNPLDQNNITDEELAKFGTFQIGPGEQHTFINDLEIPDASPELSGGARSLLYFTVITDVHIMDTESPLRFCDADHIGSLQGAYRPQEVYTTQVLDSMIRTLNDFSKDRPYDFLISLGDAVDNTQLNEVQWYINILDGKEVHPDSGKQLDIVPGPLNDFHDPFLARGLDKRVPWYQVIGNHDMLVVGVFSISAKYEAISISDTVFLGSLDDYGNIIHKGAKTTPDKSRQLLGHKGFMQQFLKSDTLPAGHGFTEENIETGYGDYVFDPNEIIRIIVLDLNCHNGSANTCIREDQFNNFLIPQLEAAEEEGKLVIIASHEYPANLSEYGNGQQNQQTEVDFETFIKTLASYPNVILHVVGHGHKNRITARKASKGNHGYYEIETSSLIDYPQQARIIEVVYNGDGKGFIFTTMVDHNSPEGSMAYEARSLSLEDIQIGNHTEGSEGEKQDRNTQLVIAIPPHIEQKIKSLELPTKIESLTTLMETNVKN